MVTKKESSAAVPILEMQMKYIEKSVEEIKQSQGEARKETVDHLEKIYNKLDNLWVTFVSRAEYSLQADRIKELETHQKVQDDKLQRLGIKFATWGGAFGAVTFIIGKLWT